MLRSAHAIHVVWIAITVETLPAPSKRSCGAAGAREEPHEDGGRQSEAVELNHPQPPRVRISDIDQVADSMQAELERSHDEGGNLPRCGVSG